MKNRRRALSDSCGCGSAHNMAGCKVLDCALSWHVALTHKLHTHTFYTVMWCVCVCVQSSPAAAFQNEKVGSVCSTTISVIERSSLIQIPTHHVHESCPHNLAVSKAALMRVRADPDDSAIRALDS
eukprot:364743-Chlamydomonas_euryale.AAC.83